MSGIEIAGLVLGAFPIVLKALTGMVEGVEETRKFRRIKRSISVCVKAIGTESLYFNKTLEKLLIDARICQRGLDIKHLMERHDSKDKTWTSGANEDLLKDYLEDSYNLYVDWVNEMLIALNEVRNELPLDANLLEDEVTSHFI